MWKYVLNKMIKQKEAIFFIVMIILSFAVSSAAPYLNGKFIDLLTVSKDIHLIVQFALIIVGVRKRSLSDYWNAGLKTIWATNVVQYLTARMQSVSDMENITTLISDINMDGCLNLDLMENDLNDLNLIKGVILEEWM